MIGVEREAERVRDSLPGTAIEAHSRQLQQLIQQPLLQLADACSFFHEQRLGHGKRLAHANDLVGGQGAGAQTALMATAMDLRLQQRFGALADIQGADAFWTINFVRGKGHQVDRPAAQVDR
ncbi:hypothetical protein D3C85_1411660 [compost metagenome]